MIGPRARSTATALLVAALALALYLPSARNGFIGYDDPLYVTANPHVMRGPTLEGLRWSLTATDGGNWHPLTWWTHMLAVEISGTWAGGHHLLNALLHAAAAGTLFLLLAGLTGARLPSLAVAALFAVHPLHVESVAWVAERKDVLAALLWVLALGAWAAHLRRPSPGRYLAALGLYLLGLAAKPMAVSLPAVMLILDFWPLGRLAPGRPRRLAPLLYEKLPFLAAAGGAAILAVAAQRVSGAFEQVAGAAPGFLATLAGIRVANVAVSYASYLGKALWPYGLAVFYPYPAHDVPGAVVALSVAALAALTALALLLRRRAPWAAAGWGWYVVALAPVAGVVQVGSQARADRYAYLPLIGAWCALAWSLRALAGRRPALRAPVAVVAIAATAVFAAVATRQLSFWRDTEALFVRALAVTGGNHLAHRLLGEEYLRQGRAAEAERELRAEVALSPRSPGARNRLGMALARQGRRAEAVAAYREALRLAPGHVEVLNNLAVDLTALGEAAEAESLLREALAREPASAPLWSNLGDALARQGRVAEAADAWRRALGLDPGLATARARLERIERRH